MRLGDVEAALARAGLRPRGAFHPGPEDAVPAMPDGRAVATLVLAGNAGPGMWAVFAPMRDGGAHALDRWSEAVLGALAAELGALALFPFAKPYLPFQRWALRAEPVHVSPLGILIHPDYGLWHGYRGALGFAQALELPPREDRPSPCATCAERPCLSACPVGAFGSAGYDVPACIRHLKDPAGRDCLEQGCRARRACPVGRAYVYEPAQAEFHMAAFFRKHAGEAAG